MSLCITFIFKSGPINPDHAQGEKITLGHEYQVGWSLETILIAAYSRDSKLRDEDHVATERSPDKFPVLLGLAISNSCNL